MITFRIWEDEDRALEFLIKQLSRVAAADGSRYHRALVVRLTAARTFAGTVLISGRHWR